MIKIGFSKHKGLAPLSWLIMFCEGTSFSHTYIKVYSKSLNRELVYQATGSGVYFISSKMFDTKNLVVEEFDLNITEDNRVKLLQWSIDNSGKPYGFLQMLGLGFKRILKLLGLEIKNPITNGSSAYVCCELVATALSTLGIKIEEDLDQIDLTTIQKIVQDAVKQYG